MGQMSVLDQIKKYTTVVVDTGDLESIQQFHPTDATTNPSLLLAASQLASSQPLIEDALKFGQSKSEEQLQWALDKLIVSFGVEILKMIPGRVSTEVDARLSFDMQGTIARAKRLVQLYAQQGVDSSRVLIKVACTWEGIQAAKVLESEHGIHCNMTLLFGLPQAVACAEAGVTLVSPFVGRILDWYKKATGRDFGPEEDPGVQSVRAIYNYYKKFDYKTIVMGASFRNTGEIVELAGCDYLTIGPHLLAQLASLTDPIGPPKLTPSQAKSLPSIKRVSYDEKSFRFALNADAMATEKLAEGIRKFSEDIEKLEAFLASKL